MMSTSPFYTHVLPNGLTIIVETMPHVRSVAAGFMVRIGARDETPQLAGVSHFLEHMMFKGTARRGWHDITIDFDRMGSTYNAFTSETRTVYYGWVRQHDLYKQLELLADMMRSMIPEEEFITEKQVILEEIAMSKDSIEHIAVDFLQEKIFAGHPLGWPILGYDHTVQDLSRSSMWSYFQQHYAPNNMYLVVAGNVDSQQVVAMAEQLCGGWKAATPRQARQAPIFQTGTDVLQTEQFQQQVITLSFPAAPATHPLAETAQTASTILGGDNSRIFWNIVQKGISPRAGSFLMDYEDVGVLILWGMCLPEQCEQMVDALRQEANLISTTTVREEEIQRVKNKRRTSLAAEAEAPYHRLTQIMDDMEYFGRPRTVDEHLAAVESINQDSISQYFSTFPIHHGGHLASVGPRRWPQVF